MKYEIINSYIDNASYYRFLVKISNEESIEFKYDTYDEGINNIDNDADKLINSRLILIPIEENNVN